MAALEQLEVKTDIRAKIIIDEATGTIVMGENVKINPVSITQGNLVINVGSTKKIQDKDRGTKSVDFSEGTSLQELVNGLNKLGVWPKDIVNILQNIQAAGALQAEIEVR
jgi:flagellar P-ring protein precursor FlgI